MEALIKSIELGSRIKRFRVPRARVFVQSAGMLFVYYAFRAELQKTQNHDELELKKERLSMPIYDLKEADLDNPPWAGDNYEVWKYRLVRLSGRQVHRNTMFIPHDYHNYPSFDYIVPVVVHENQTFSNQKGFLVNRGLIPHEYKDSSNRWRMEDAKSKFEFVGMVTRGETIDKKSFFKRGNVWDEQRFIFNNFFLPDMARATGFVNKRAVEQAVIEVVDLNETELNEKDPNIYAKNMSGTTTFPYPKTLAGALQPTTSDSELTRKQVGYLALAALAFLY